MTKQQEGKVFERVIFEYDKAEPKHWDRFTKLTDELFLESDLWKIWDNELIDAQTKSDMLWMAYQSSVRIAAETHIPHKTINNKKKEINARKKQIIPHHYFSTLKTIRTLLKICRSKFGSEPTVDEILRFTKKITVIDSTYNLPNNIKSLPEEWNSEWYDRLLTIGTFIKQEAKALRVQQEVKLMMEQIDR